MGWKASMLIVNQPTAVDREKLLQDLGFANLMPIEDQPLEVAIFPQEGQVYIGTYKGNLVICARSISQDFIEAPDTGVKRVLLETFPSSEICAIVLHSVVNLRGFVVLKNGKTLRARAGSADEGTFLEIGEPLEEEKELLSRAIVAQDGKRTYVFPEEGSDEPYSEDQIGEDFVFKVSKRYFGEQLNFPDDEFFDVKLTGYAYGFIYARPFKASRTSEKKVVKREWKKHLIILIVLLMFLIWRIFSY